MSWDELVASALVGTARRPPALPEGTGSPVARVLAGLDRGDAERAVLAAGAALGLYRQAGWRPPVDIGPPPPVAGPEDRPRCSDAAASRLDAMLGGRFRSLLGEWLDAVVAARRIVPPDRLPPVLDAATADPALRAAAVAAAGARGQWLAGRNPRWAWASGGGPDPATTWATGSAPARRLLLERLRATDPSAALQLLASTWATEAADDRATLVAALATGLGADDEAFLEAALDDRGKQVRQVAADLLSRLPGSRLAGRMAERSRPLLRIAGQGGARVEVTLPEDVDPAMVRDGVVARPSTGSGERSWWLHQLVAATPLATWTEAMGEPPRRLVQLADPAVRRAWAAAAARQRDEEWALALLDAGDVDEPELLGAVPHDRAVRVAADRVARLGLTPEVLDLLDRCPPPWDEALSRAVVQRLAAAVDGHARPGPAALARPERLVRLATRVDPSLTPVAAAALADHAERWSEVVGRFLDLLAFRAEMAEELGP